MVTCCQGMRIVAAAVQRLQRVLRGVLYLYNKDIERHRQRVVVQTPTLHSKSHTRATTKSTLGVGQQCTIEKHLEKLLDVLGQGRTTRQDELDTPTEALLDLGKDQRVKAGRCLGCKGLKC